MSTYQTWDISIAAFFLLEGIELLKIEQYSRDELVFTFPNTLKLQQSRLKYCNYDARVCPFDYSSMLLFLQKAII